MRSTGGAPPLYDPKAYWSARPNPNHEQGLRPSRIRFDEDYIRRHTSGCAAVLEVGPGIGRTLAAHRDRQTLSALDITDRYRRQLEERAISLGITLDFHLMGDAEDPFPFDDKAFDAVVSCQVLLHQKEAVMRRHLSEMSRVSRKIVLISGLYRGAAEPPQTPDPASYVYHHDYIEALSALGLRADDVVSREKALYLTASTEAPATAAQ